MVNKGEPVRKLHVLFNENFPPFNPKRLLALKAINRAIKKMENDEIPDEVLNLTIRQTLLIFKGLIKDGIL